MQIFAYLLAVGYTEPHKCVYSQRSIQPRRARQTYLFFLSEERVELLHEVGEEIQEHAVERGEEIVQVLLLQFGGFRPVGKRGVILVLQHARYLAAHVLALVYVLRADAEKLSYVFLLQVVALVQLVVDVGEFDVCVLQFLYGDRQFVVHRPQLVARHGYAFALPHDIQQRQDEHHGEQAYDGDEQREPAVLCHRYVLHVLVYVAQQRRYLPATYARSKLLRGVPRQRYVAVCPVHVAAVAQFARECPQRRLVAHGILYVADGRHRQPVHHAVALTHFLVDELTAVGGHGILLCVFLELAHLSVAHGKRLLVFSRIDEVVYLFLIPYLVVSGGVEIERVSVNVAFVIVYQLCLGVQTV